MTINNIVIEATDNAKDIAQLITALLIELAPSAKDDIHATELEQVAKNLLAASKIWVFIAKCNDENVGIITLHECAAIYAGGVFGEISELYVKPDFRSSNIGELLLNAAVLKANELDWMRLEVGSPPANESSRTIKFYENNGFKCTGSRLRRLI